MVDAHEYRSRDTKWGRVAAKPREDSPYHGFANAGVRVNRSYCGLTFTGPKRSSPPEPGAVICPKCAEACGFARRATRIQRRVRGNRRLASITERLEYALDQMEKLLGIDHTEEG